MGGYGSGGHNRKKDNIASLLLLDSYDDRDVAISGVKTENVQRGVAAQRNFVCTICGKRVRFLYKSVQGKEFCCRGCVNANYPSQQLSEGEYAKERIFKILEELDVDIWNFTNMGEVLKFKPAWPAYKMTKRKYLKFMDELIERKIIWWEYVTKKGKG